MNTPDETAETWFATTFCHDCKAARLLVWQRGDYDTDGPSHAVKLPAEWERCIATTFGVGWSSLGS